MADSQWPFIHAERAALITDLENAADAAGGPRRSAPAGQSGKCWLT